MNVCKLLIQVSADANVTRRTVPHSQSAIVLYTEQDVDCDQQSALVVDCRPHLPRLPLLPGAVNNRLVTIAVYITLADGRRAVAAFLSPQFVTKFQREVPSFLEKP